VLGSRTISSLRSESGQTVMEYILLLAIVVGFISIVRQGLTDYAIIPNLSQMVSRDFKAAYQYGHPKTKGPEDGPERHIRFTQGGNFRMFLNPRERGGSP